MSFHPDLVRIAIGSSQQANYVEFPVAPYVTYIVYPREIYAPDGAVYDDGLPSVTLTWKRLEAVDFWQTLSIAGVADIRSRVVTLQLPNRERESVSSYNGRCKQPVAEQDYRFDGHFYYVAVSLTVCRLVQI